MLHTVFIFHLFTHTYRHSGFIFLARLLPPGTQQQRRCKGVKDTARDCVYAGVFASQPLNGGRESERGGARGQLALTCTGLGGLRHRTRGLLLLIFLLPQGVRSSWASCSALRSSSSLRTAPPPDDAL